MQKQTKGDAGAEATEKRRNVTFSRGGKGKNQRMFGPQAAESQTDNDQAGHTADPTGPDDAPGRKFAQPGYGTPGIRSRIGVAAPAEPGRTGNVHGSRPRPRGR
jgi:hypothetical protein